ncbi:MAG: hypothetical protein AAFV01_17950, partial [Bacteroidota bacterium]
MDDVSGTNLCSPVHGTAHQDEFSESKLGKKSAENRSRIRLLVCSDVTAMFTPRYDKGVLSKCED